MPRLSKAGALLLLAAVAAFAAGTNVVAEEDAVTVPQRMNYQGKLTDPAGTPLNGNYTMSFTIYDGTTPVWTETQNNVPVAQGIFNVILGAVVPITGVPEAGVCSLQVAVNTQPITPKIPLLSVPYTFYAGKSDDADKLGGTAAAQYIKNGTAAGGQLAGTYPNPTIAQMGATSGQVLQWNGSAWAPVTFSASLWTNSGSGYLYPNTPNQNTYARVYGTGYSYRFYAQTSADYTYGLYGYNSYYYGAGVYGYNSGYYSYGVYGYNSQYYSAGVYGYTSTSYSYGVAGTAYGSYSYGVYGYASSYTGNYGVYGYGYYYGVQGYCGAYSSFGTLGSYNNGYPTGVYGYSGSYYGVYGYTGGSSYAAVYGYGYYYGVQGYSSAVGTWGILGRYGGGSPYAGVYGYTSSGSGFTYVGVYGYGPYVSVMGYSSSYGNYSCLAGYNNGYPAGVYGYCAGYYGYYLYYVGSSYGNYTYNTSGYYTQVCYSSYKIYGNGSVSTFIIDENDQERTLHCPEAPEVVFEDYGSARLTNGYARVDIDPLLLRGVVINEQYPLRVYVTPTNGEAIPLGVRKGQTWFEVAGPAGSDATFDWRIVANRAGFQNQRFEAHPRPLDRRGRAEPTPMNPWPEEQVRARPVSAEPPPAIREEVPQAQPPLPTPNQ